MERGKRERTQGHRPPTQRAGRRETRPAARGADGRTKKAARRRWSGAARTITTGVGLASGASIRLQRLLWVNHAWPAGCPLVDSPLWEPYDRTIFAGHVAARESPSGPATARTRHRCLLDTLTFFCGSAICSPPSLLHRVCSGAMRALLKVCAWAVRSCDGSCAWRHFYAGLPTN